eukprot:428128_1
MTLPADSPLLLSMVLANRDPNVFINPNEFDCDRDNLGEVITWNGLEKLISADTGKPPRYCPGHNLVFKVVEYIVNQLKPRLINANSPITINKINMTDLDDVHSDLDNYTKTVMKFIGEAARKQNENPPTAVDIGQPRITDADTEIAAICGINLAQTDEDTNESIIKSIFREIVNSNFLGKHDINKDWTSIDAAIKWRNDNFDDLPSPNIKYDELVSDKIMSQLAFSSICCHYTRGINTNEKTNDDSIPSDAKFVSDFSALSRFEVRSGYEKYGAIAYFNSNYKIIGIYWCHMSKLISVNDSHWNHAKWVWRCSMFAHITVIDHLFETHLLTSNLLVTTCIEKLPPTHPLRMFLKPFVYKTVTINQQAFKSLINTNGLVERLWTFEYDELLNIFNFAKENRKFRILPDYIHPSMRNVDDSIFGFNKDAIEFWHVMINYIAEYISIYYPNNNDIFNDKYVVAFINRICLQLNIDEIKSGDCETFIDVLTQLIVTVTGIHEHIGQVSGFVMSPIWLGTRLRPQMEICSIQEYTQLLSLTLITGLKSPQLMQDWSHLIKRDDNYDTVKLLYKKWHDDLNHLANEIEKKK